MGTDETITAERDIRMVKVKQKIYGGLRTLGEGETFCAIRSYISAVKEQGRNIIDAIESALVGQPLTRVATDAQPV